MVVFNKFSIFSPLFLFKSRAAFIGVYLYFYEFIKYAKSVKIFNKRKLYLYLLCIGLLTSSTIQTQTRAIPEDVSLNYFKSYSKLGSYKFSLSGRYAIFIY